MNPPTPATGNAARAQDFHQRTLVLDSLTPIYILDEPYTARMIAGGVNAGFLSVCSDATWEAALARTEIAHEKIEKNPHLMLATCAADLRAAKAKGKIALMMVTQAADMIGSDPRRVALMYRLGFRVLGLCYSFANLCADGCAEPRDAGLTFLGREVIAAVNELPMLLDLSHSGHRTSYEAAELARAPCVTHANAYAVTANDRNKKDEMLKLMAAKGGVIGVCGLPRSVRAENPTIEQMLDHADYMIRLIGAEHVGIGLDFMEAFKETGVVLPQSRRNRTLRPDIFGSVDDFLNQPYPQGLTTIAETPNFTRGLFERGHDEQSVALVMGEAWVRALERVEALSQTA